MALETKEVAVPLPKETLGWFNGDELRARTFYEKYAMRGPDGKQVEVIPPSMWRRVAHEIASVEKTPEKREEWENNFFWLLENWRFIPGGRILFGAGQPRKSTLLNCYVLKAPTDSIEGIFDTAKEMARTYSYGGGVGIDISELRPKGAVVNNSAIVSTGAISFMELYSVTTATIGQAGRRGALMLSISVEHPDVVDFVNIKKDLTKVTHANISVRVTDAFMKAVENDTDFRLHFDNEKVHVTKIIKARDLWNQLVDSAWRSAEPGLLFWDTIKRMSTTEYNGMEVAGVNPCSEETLESYGSCCLGSINLSAFVEKPFSTDPRMDLGGLSKAYEYSTRFLDNVLDYNADKHPLPAQREASLRGRRIGVGITGLGDMLIKMKMKYDEESTIRFVDTLMGTFKKGIYDTSIQLAHEKGSFPAFDVEKHLAQPFIQQLPQSIRDGIKEVGLRNSALSTVPPVGSGSILAGSSSGVEPVFAFSYKRRSHSLTQGEFEVKQPILKEYEAVGGDVNNLPSYFIASHQIKPEFRVAMQGTVQKHIDTAISSTINLPEDVSRETVGQIYFNAWKAGCKGVTVYREGSREGILETSEVGKKKLEEPVGLKLDAAGDHARPKIMSGKTVKLHMVQGSLYLTLNSNGKPKEVFITLGKHGQEAKADAEAIGRLISLYLQSGGTVENVIASLKGIQGGQISWDAGTKLLSIPDAVSKALSLLTSQPTDGLPGPVTGVGNPVVNVEVSAPKLEICPDCHETSLIESGGCRTCESCGYSKCG